jgi:hypothetical protein
MVAENCNAFSQREIQVLNTLEMCKLLSLSKRASSL